MKKILTFTLSLALLISLLTMPAAAEERDITLSEQYGRLYIENVIAQKTLQSDKGELVVYTVAPDSKLCQELLFGYCYRVDRWLAVEENSSISYTDDPNLGWDLDILEEGMLIEPFYYTMNAENKPGFIHVIEVEVRDKNVLSRFGLQFDPTAMPKTSRYQSTAELTSSSVAEMDFDEFILTITNPTDGYDSGTIAIVLASHMGTIHFVDYELAPKETKDYHISVSGHIGVGTNERMVVLGKGWGAYLNADIITFTSDEDLDAYRSAVVYEENLDYYVEQGTGSGVNAYVVICNGQPGDDWLKNYTGIQRHDKPHLDPAVTHDICKH